MWNKIPSSPLVYPSLLIGVIVSTTLGFLISNKIVLPFLNIAFAYPVLFALLAGQKRKRALATMLFWALAMGVVTVLATVYFPARAEASIFHGKEYAGEMFHWIKTGEGAEGDPAQFVPQHLLHLLIFTVLSFASGSIFSLFMGAVLMNYMCFYVGSLMNASNDALLAALMGWHPWSIIRVVSFVVLGVILGEPVICRITRRKYEFAEVRLFFWLALAGILVDIIMKAFLAPWWGLALRKLL